MLLLKGVGWVGAPLEETACIDKDLILIGMEAVGKKEEKKKKKLQHKSEPVFILIVAAAARS